jgi:hypothetical protein
MERLTKTSCSSDLQSKTKIECDPKSIRREREVFGERGKAFEIIDYDPRETPDTGLTERSDDDDLHLPAYPRVASTRARHRQMCGGGQKAIRVHGDRRSDV